MFPCVWLHFKKFFGKYFLVFGKEEGKHKSRKTQATTQKKINNDDKSSPTTAIVISPSSRDRDRRRDCDLARSRSRSMARSLSSRDRDRRHDLAKRRLRSRIAVVGLELVRSARTGARSSPAIVGLTGMFLLLSRALSLSLSFSGNTLKGK